MAAAVVFAIAGDGATAVRVGDEHLRSRERGPASERATRPPYDIPAQSSAEAWERPANDRVKKAWRDMIGADFESEGSGDDDDEYGAVRDDFYAAAGRFSFAGMTDDLIHLLDAVFIRDAESKQNFTLRRLFGELVVHQAMRMRAEAEADMEAAAVHGRHVLFLIEAVAMMCVRWLATGVNYTAEYVRVRYIDQRSNAAVTAERSPSAPLALSLTEARALVAAYLGSEVAEATTIEEAGDRVTVTVSHALLQALANAAATAPFLLDGVPGFPGASSSLFGVLLREASAASHTMTRADPAAAKEFDDYLASQPTDCTPECAEAAAVAWPLRYAYQVFSAGDLVSSELASSSLTAAYAVAGARVFVDLWRDTGRWESAGLTLSISDRHRLVGLEYHARDLCATVRDLPVLRSFVTAARRMFAGRGSSIAEMSSDGNRIPYRDIAYAYADASASSFGRFRSAFARWFFNSAGAFMWGEHVAETAYVSGFAVAWEAQRRRSARSAAAAVSNLANDLPAYALSAARGRITGLLATAGQLADSDITYVRLMDYAEAGAENAAVLGTFRRYYAAMCPSEAASNATLVEHYTGHLPPPLNSTSLQAALTSHLLNPSIGRHLRAHRLMTVRRAVMAPLADDPSAPFFSDTEDREDAAAGVFLDSDSDEYDDYSDDEAFLTEEEDPSGASIFGAVSEELDQVEEEERVLLSGTSTEDSKSSILFESSESELDQTMSPAGTSQTSPLEDLSSMGRALLAEVNSFSPMDISPASAAQSPSSPMNIDQGEVRTPLGEDRPAVSPSISPLSTSELPYYYSSGMESPGTDYLTDPEDTPQTPAPRPSAGIRVAPGEVQPAAAAFAMPRPLYDPPLARARPTATPYRRSPFPHGGASGLAVLFEASPGDSLNYDPATPLSASSSSSSSAAGSASYWRRALPTRAQRGSSSNGSSSADSRSSRSRFNDLIVDEELREYAYQTDLAAAELVNHTPPAASASSGESIAFGSDYSLELALSHPSFDIAADATTFVPYHLIDSSASSEEVSRRRAYAEGLARGLARRLGASPPSSSSSSGGSGSGSGGESSFGSDYPLEVGGLDFPTPAPLELSPDVESPRDAARLRDYADARARTLARKLGLSPGELEAYSPPPFQGDGEYLSSSDGLISPQGPFEGNSPLDSASPDFPSPISTASSGGDSYDLTCLGAGMPPPDPQPFGKAAFLDSDSDSFNWEEATSELLQALVPRNPPSGVAPETASLVWSFDSDSSPPGSSPNDALSPTAFARKLVGRTPVREEAGSGAVFSVVEETAVVVDTYDVGYLEQFEDDASAFRGAVLAWLNPASTGVPDHTSIYMRLQLATHIARLGDALSATADLLVSVDVLPAPYRAEALSIHARHAPPQPVLAMTEGPVPVFALRSPRSDGTVFYYVITPPLMNRFVSVITEVRRAVGQLFGDISGMKLSPEVYAATQYTFALHGLREAIAVTHEHTFRKLQNGPSSPDIAPPSLTRAMSKYATTLARLLDTVSLPESAMGATARRASALPRM